MTKYIFLDIDDVLNSEHTLIKSCENMDQKIVLSSSWRVYFNENTKKPINLFALILLDALNKHNLELHDMTPFVKGQFSNERGLEIKTYVEKNNITDYVVIDDEEFSDFKTHLDMSRFIQTNFGNENTTIENEGLNKKVAEKAIEILNKGQKQND